MSATNSGSTKDFKSTGISYLMNISEMRKDKRSCNECHDNSMAFATKNVLSEQKSDARNISDNELEKKNLSSKFSFMNAYE